MLELENVHVGYGLVQVLHGVTLSVKPGNTIALIGANGAGKSTTLKTISGLLRPTSGRILLSGRNLAGLSAPEIVHLGIAHVPEGRQVFATLSVEQNLKLGNYIHRAQTSPQAWAQELDTVLQLFPDLKPKLQDRAGALSGGQQQMLAIARSLMTRPQVLLMDEPSLGLGPQVIDKIFQVIQDLRCRGIAILLVEQNAGLALQIADYGYVMEGGVIALEGAGRDLLHNEQVVHRYLGIGDAVQDRSDLETRRQLTENLRIVLREF